MIRVSSLNKRTALRLVGVPIFCAVLYFADIKDVLARINYSLAAAMAICLIPVAASFIFRALRFQAVATILLGPHNFLPMLRAAIIESGLMQFSSLLAPPVKLLYTNAGTSITQKVLVIFLDKVFEYILPFYFLLGSLLALTLDFSAGIFIFFWLVLLLFMRKPMLAIFMKLMFLFSRLNIVFRKLSPFAEELFVKQEKYRLALGYKNYIYTILVAAMFYICFYILSIFTKVELTFPQLFIVLTLSAFVGIIPFTFMGIGTRDAGLAFLFHLNGRPIEDAVIISLGMLGIRALILCISGICWLLYPPDAKAPASLSLS